MLSFSAVTGASGDVTPASDSTGDFPLSPPRRRPSNTASLRREPPRMEPRGSVTTAPLMMSSPPPLPVTSPPAVHAPHRHMPFMSQRHPAPPPLDLNPMTPAALTPPPSSSGGAAELPPPLPPRLKRESSAGSGSELTLSPVKTPPDINAAMIPAATAVPPLPPRTRNINSTLVNRSLGIDPLMAHTLPAHVPRRIPLHNNAVMTLPRRNSERDYLAAAQPQFVNVVNGGGSERGGSVTPELPPKTYRSRSVIHSRQQSS